MGGSTKTAPVVDDDAIWIGSSVGGSPSNSFRGYLDSIAVHREILDDATISGRFRRVATSSSAKDKEPAKEAPAEMPDLGPIPSNEVLVTFHEGMPGHDRWLYDDETLPRENAALDDARIPLAAFAATLRCLGHSRKLESSRACASCRRCETPQASKRF